MKKQHKKFIKKLKKFLREPGAEHQRITQALYNLGVTISASERGFYLDNYNESDEVILQRMKKNMYNTGKHVEEVKI